MLLLSSKAFFVRFCDVDKTLQINATVTPICNLDARGIQH